jgi:GAF domain-containing protein
VCWPRSRRRCGGSRRSWRVGVPPNEIFAAVAEEVGRLVAFDGTRILRFEGDGSATLIAGWSESVEVPPELEVGARMALEGDGVATRVFRTGRPARIDNYTNAEGPVSEPLQRAGVRSAAGAPIIVEGRLWGVIAAGSTKPGPLRSGMELRLAIQTNSSVRAIVGSLISEYLWANGYVETDSTGR